MGKGKYGKLAQPALTGALLHNMGNFVNVNMFAAKHEQRKPNLQQCQQNAAKARKKRKHKSN